MKAAKGCAEMFHKWREDWTRVTAAGMGTRTRESLKLTLKNAKELDEASEAAPAASGKRSAFWGKKK
jgi:hypothetical protein